MRAVVLIAATLLTAGAQPAPARVPVVVELFTSEGCSSCPPADAVLSALAKQPVPGVEIIPLGMHVTYWDQLGWRDPASLVLATERQQNYSRVFGEDRVYTPQAVVDGREELIGSADAGIRQAVLKAARQPHVPVSLRATIDGAAIKAEASIGTPADSREKLAAWIVITEDGLSSEVKRGENGGRTLHHDAVVRAIFGGDLKAARIIAANATLDRRWRPERMHVAAIVQDTHTQRIVGAAQTLLK